MVVESTPPYAATALALGVKQWKQLGLNDGDEETAPTGDLDVLVERVTALLVVRCVAINAKKDEYPDLSTTSICRTALMRQEDWPEPLSEEVISQIRAFSHAILSRYNDVPYHNREHAFHVVISANKLLDMMLQEKKTKTFGLRNDALMQFCLIFAALIHDVEHQGLPNRQLCNEDTKLAVTYNDQSVAENRSLFIGFNELLKDKYSELRFVLFGDSKETDPAIAPYYRFRRQVIQLVLNTDIANPERTSLFKSKWNETFEKGDEEEEDAPAPQPKAEEKKDDEVKRRGSRRPKSNGKDDNTMDESEKDAERRRSSQASNYSGNPKRLGIRMSMDLSGEAVELYRQVTEAGDSDEEPDDFKMSVILELFLQSADVGHNLQGFDQMTKWSGRLYLELQRAYLMGRGTDPKSNWFDNQIGFLEFYLLPLANKLEETGVFGGHIGKLFAQNVIGNRDRWLKEGQEVTEEIIEEGNQMDLNQFAPIGSSGATTAGECDEEPTEGNGTQDYADNDDEDDLYERIDWIKVAMVFIIVVLLGVIIEMSQFHKIPAHSADSGGNSTSNTTNTSWTEDLPTDVFNGFSNYGQTAMTRRLRGHFKFYY